MTQYDILEYINENLKDEQFTSSRIAMGVDIDRRHVQRALSKLSGMFIECVGQTTGLHYEKVYELKRKGGDLCVER